MDKTGVWSKKVIEAATKAALRPKVTKIVGLKTTPLDRNIKYVSSVVSTVPNTRKILKDYLRKQISKTKAEGMLSVRQSVSLDDLHLLKKGELTKKIETDKEDTISIDKKTQKTLKDVGLGAAAGSVSTVITKPLENIEYNISTQGKYRGKPWLEVAKGLAKEKGPVGALWHGTGAKLLKVAPSMGLTFATYELLKKQFND